MYIMTELTIIIISCCIVNPVSSYFIICAIYSYKNYILCMFILVSCQYVYTSLSNVL